MLILADSSVIIFVETRIGNRVTNFPAVFKIKAAFITIIIIRTLVTHNKFKTRYMFESQTFEVFLVTNFPETSSLSLCTLALDTANSSAL